MPTPRKRHKKGKPQFCARCGKPVSGNRRAKGYVCSKCRSK